MTFTELMNALTGLVVRLQRDGADLAVLSEEETLTPLLLNGLSAHKAELLDLIDRNGGDWLSPAFTITPEMPPLAQLNAIDRQLQARFNPRRYRLDVRQAPLMRGFAAYDAAGDRWLLRISETGCSGEDDQNCAQSEGGVGEEVYQRLESFAQAGASV